MSSSNHGSGFVKLLRLLRSPSELAQLYRESTRIQMLLKKLPFYVSLLLITWTLYIAALLTWLIIPEPKLTRPVLDNTTRKIVSSQSSQYGTAQIAKWALFGQADKKTPVKVIKPTKIVRETNVRIGLIGIVFSAHKHENRIIVSNGAKGDKLYKTGAILPGNIKVDAIHQDHIILVINNERVRKTLKTVEARETRQKKIKNNKKEN